jgi:hypothetical protein
MWSIHTRVVREINTTDPSKHAVWSVLPVNPLPNESVVEYVAVWCARQLRAKGAWPESFSAIRNSFLSFAYERAKYPRLAGHSIEKCVPHFESFESPEVNCSQPTENSTIHL